MFTADTLFGDGVAATQRGFDSPGEMNADMVKIWNSCVRDGDVVWVLGSFFSVNAIPAPELMQALNGTKYLIAGQLDQVFMPNALNAKNLASRVAFHRELGFAGVVTGRAIARKIGLPVTLPLRTRADNLATPVSLSAFAYDAEQPDRFAAWRPKRPRTGVAPWLLHGGQEEWTVHNRQVNVSADAWNLEPVGADMILDLIDDAESSHGS